MEKYNISVGRSRWQKVWNRAALTWEELVKRLSEPLKTKETTGEFFNMSKSEQDNIKDVGGFVGGRLKNGIRKADRVISRSILTLDADFATNDFVENVDMFAYYAYCIYSTHKHTADKPRYRLVIPLDRDVTPDEYEAIARKVAEQIGIEQFDDTTHQAHRLMYYPSVSLDGEFVFTEGGSEPLKADYALGLYDDWQDVSEWPKSSRTVKVFERALKKQEDPYTKSGVIGAFCRCYSIDEAIAEFLPEVYTVCGNGRYTYAAGSSSAGLVIYEDKFAYSNHATDPAGGRLCNAFDLVRIHKFADKDEEAKDNTPTNRMPSYKAMLDFAAKDDNVKLQIFNDKVGGASDDFSENDDIDNSWALELQPGDRGKAYANTIANVVLILQNDPKFKGKIGFNEFTYRRMVTERLAWDRGVFKERVWSDTDDANLRLYLEKIYDIKGKNIVDDALSVVANENKYHPVRNYLKGLKWDGVKRVETLFCDYLGADDNIYVRGVTRKTLVAAVARIFMPGIKFDTALTLVGSQGCGKSQIINRLGRGWFSDSLTTVLGKDAYEQIQGFWIIEMPELNALRKLEEEAIKSFMAKSEDSYRGAYERNTTIRPRQCIFIGTTNRFEFLKDPTGGRRFWPVDVHPERSKKDMWAELTPDEVDMIWAEAVQLYNEGETIYLDDEKLKAAAEAEQESHFESNPMTQEVIRYFDMLLPEDWDKYSLVERRIYLDNDFETDVEKAKGTYKRQKVCVLEVWCELFRGEKTEIDRRKSREIKDIILKTGEWIPVKTTLKFGVIYGNQRGFVKA